MADRIERCETCRFWEAFDETDPQCDGWCHRYPPTQMSDMRWQQLIQSGEDYDGENNWFPVTRFYTWCGEHQPRAAQSQPQ